MSYMIQYSVEFTYVWYISSIFLATFFAFLSQKFSFSIEGKLYINKIYWSLSFLCLFIPVAFRGYGIDHDSYREIFAYINTSYYEYNGFPELLFMVLNFTIGKTLNDFQFIYIFSAFISLGLIYFAFSRRINSSSLAICVWLFSTCSYFYMYGLVRMFLAMGIVFYAHKFIESKKFYKYLILIIIAGLFHYSAFIMIPLYFVLINKSGKTLSIRTNIIYAIFALLATPAMFYVSSKLFINIFSRSAIFSRYLNYFVLNFDLNGLKNMAWSWPLIFIVLFFGKYIADSVYDGKSLIKMFWVFVGISMLSTLFPIFRLTFFLNYVGFYLFASIPKINFVKKDKPLVLFIFNSIVFILGLIYVYMVFFDSIFIEPFLVPYFINFP